MSLTEVRPGTGLRGRYRTWYEKLPTGLQMIGMQVWLPIFFVIAFLFCYVYAFHAPTFQNVPVAVVGPSVTATPVAHAIQQGSKGAVTVRVIESIDDAKAEVRRGNIAAAYEPGQGSATLVVASAASFQLSSLAQQFFQGVAAQSHATVTVDDLAPLPANDSFGTSLFYLTLVCTISGYMMAMFVGMMGGGLRHWQRFSVFGASSILLPGLAILLGRFAIHAVSGHFWQLWLVGAATSFAVGCVVNGLAYFMGRFVTGAALLVFVFANVPGSGGAYPPELVPQPFRFLHDFVSGSATVGLFRRTVYDVGPAAWHFWLTLAAYTAVGLALSFAGRPYFVWRMRRQRLAGRKTMMISAQIASMTNAGYVTPVLAGAAVAPALEQSPARTGADSDVAATGPAPQGAAQTAATVLVPQRVDAERAHESAPAGGLQHDGLHGDGPQHGGPHADGPQHGRHRHDHGRHHRDPIEDLHDAERGTDPSAEEADGDAVAAETGAAG